jgi:hypothetical protein
MGDRRTAERPAGNRLKRRARPRNAIDDAARVGETGSQDMHDGLVKDRLLDNALTRFADEGFDAVSVDKVRTAAGVSNGSFFHFVRYRGRSCRRIVCRVRQRLAGMRCHRPVQCAKRTGGRGRHRAFAPAPGAQKSLQGAIHAGRGTIGLVCPSGRAIENPQCSFCRRHRPLAFSPVSARVSSVQCPSRSSWRCSSARPISFAECG